MYVSVWSRILYIMLLVISISEFLCNIFGAAVKTIYVQHILNIIVMTCVISSLTTYIYGKFKNFHKEYH